MSGEVSFAQTAYVCHTEEEREGDGKRRKA